MVVFIHFRCRKSYAELLEFSEESLQIAKTFILTSTDFIDRVAGLYLLYGLYNKIPLNDIKIRVTLKEWEFLLQFFDQLKSEKLHDASYIFSKLVTDNAFYHCLFTTEVIYFFFQFNLSQLNVIILLYFFSVWPRKKFQNTARILIFIWKSILCTPRFSWWRWKGRSWSNSEAEWDIQCWKIKIIKFNIKN